jgi:hypothetical protein
MTNHSSRAKSNMAQSPQSYDQVDVPIKYRKFTRGTWSRPTPAMIEMAKKAAAQGKVRRVANPRIDREQPAADAEIVVDRYGHRF